MIKLILATTQTESVQSKSNSYSVSRALVSVTLPALLLSVTLSVPRTRMALPRLSRTLAMLALIKLALATTRTVLALAALFLAECIALTSKEDSSAQISILQSVRPSRVVVDVEQQLPRLKL